MNAGRVGSWGRYPPELQQPHPISWRDEVAQEMESAAAKFDGLLPYGNGRSYGDSCLAASGHVLAMRSLARFISADWESGLITAEAGVTLEEVLALAIPKGWFLPVTPGTKYVTLGGAIANDVHGKNHHVRGTFGNHVRRFGLVRSDQPPVECSMQDNQNLYRATIGGLGLTGVIDWVELQLVPITSSRMDVTTVRFGTLQEFFELSAELDETNEYTVAWVDCLAKGPTAGRGVFMAANHAQRGGLKVDTRKKLAVPATPPISAINGLTLRMFNSTYFGMHSPTRRREPVDYDPFFYPLDRILEWNRIYGPKGFQQYQCVIPEGQAQSATRELLSAIATSGEGSFLAVLKKCGNLASPGLLSFPMAGTSLALDFPQRAAANGALFRRLDAIVRHSGGRLYPAKDAHMSGDDFRSFYPDWTKLEKLRDPILRSRFWKRVTEE
jgi:FAD/FMN-containing dehydrogenase